MNNLREQIEGILLEIMCDCNPYGKYQSREEAVSALLTLFTEERARLRGEVEKLLSDYRGNGLKRDDPQRIAEDARQGFGRIVLSLLSEPTDTPTHQPPHA